MSARPPCRLAGLAQPPQAQAVSRRGVGQGTRWSPVWGGRGKVGAPAAGWVVALEEAAAGWGASVETEAAQQRLAGLQMVR